MATFGHNSDKVLTILNHEINPLFFGSNGPTLFVNIQYDELALAITGPWV